MNDPYENPEIASNILGLTLYDVSREPRPPITDDSTTTLQVRTLNIELTCPVCLGILHNTMTVMECLHRFCANCISKSLRLGKKECPTCRVKCSSRRHLRPDPNIDGIIAAIYPNLEEFEAKEESMIEQINRSIMKSGTLVDSIEIGKKRQAMAKSSRTTKRESSKASKSDAKAKPKRQAKDKKAPTPKRRKKEEDEEDSFATAASAKQDNGPEISFVLLRHPNEKDLAQLSNKYLRTSRQISVRHLCKFLAKKFDMLDFKVFKIGIYPSSQPLTEDLTLDIIDKEVWCNPSELKLYYKLATTA